MLHSIFTFPVFQIHNSNRKDRQALTHAWSSQYTLQHVEAIMKFPGHEGCALSHAKVASLQSNPYIVLEDDAYPSVTAYTDPSVLAALQGDEDILYLGGVPWCFPSYKRLHVYNGGCTGTYALLVRNKGIAWMQQFKYTGKPIDVELLHSGLQLAFVHPPLFTHAITPSEVGSSAFTRSLYFAHFLPYATIVRYVLIWRWQLLFCCCICVYTKCVRPFLA